VIILIPCYQPDGELLELIAALGDQHIVLADDGSGPRHAGVFDAARAAGASSWATRTTAARGSPSSTAWPKSTTSTPATTSSVPTATASTLPPTSAISPAC
jgi:hypothetical protein